jgi:TPR repeat protein
VADRNVPLGQYGYGKCLLRGSSVPRNETAAAEYFKLSADQGDVGGQYWYARCVLEGIGVLIDESGALHYFQLAASQGKEKAR